MELNYYELLPIVHLEDVWNSNQMITEGDAAITLETTRRAFRNQEQSKQRLGIVIMLFQALSYNMIQRSS